MTLTGATVFTGVATSVLAVGSLVAAAFAIAAYFGQREQVRAIRHQVEDQEAVNKKQADEQRRSRAAKVTAWLGRTEDGSWKACIRNASDEPVFDVLTSFHAIQKNLEKAGSLSAKKKCRGTRSYVSSRRARIAQS